MNRGRDPDPPSKEGGPSATQLKGTAASANTGRRQATGCLDRNLRSLRFRLDFQRGALDALRMVSRRTCCVNCAAEVDQLTEYYLGAADRWAS
jgi:hypothetical protein